MRVCIPTALKGSPSKMARSIANMDGPKLIATKDLLTCAVCLEIYSNPKSLRCLHTFCFPCLQKIQDKIRRWIICPLCKAQTPITVSGINGLPSDFRIEQMKEILESENGPRQSFEGSFCNVCKADGGECMPAEFHCKKCSVFYCGMCVSKHNSNPMFTAHHVTKLLTDTSKSTLLCTSHPTHFITYLCRTCKPQSLLCSICILSHDQIHTTIELAEASKVIRKELQDNLNDICTGNDLLCEYQSKADKMKEHYERILTAAQEGISKQAILIIAEVQKEEIRMLKLAQERVEGLMSKYTKVGVAEEISQRELVKRELEDILKCSDEACIVDHQNFSEKIKDMKEVRLPKAVPRLDIQFIPNEASGMKFVFGSFKDVKVTENEELSPSNIKGPAKSKPQTPPAQQAPPQTSRPLRQKQQQQQIQPSLRHNPSSMDTTRCDCCQEEKAPLVGLYCLQQRCMERLCQKCRRMHDVIGHPLTQQAATSNQV